MGYSNRDMTIMGLESLHERLVEAAEHDRIAMIDAMVVENAIRLLKEKKTVKPYLGFDMVWRCGYCKEAIAHRNKVETAAEQCDYQYCKVCGNEVKWDDDTNSYI